jgi:phosphoribosylanthranilate isomerase
MIIKVCGMREESNIRAVEQLDIDWMGFIFYPPSARYVGEKLSYLPQKVKRVGVFVNEEQQIVRERALQNRLQIIQLHGKESPAYCRELREDGFTVLKSFGIETDKPFPLAEVARYRDCCDYFLFDAQSPIHGGAGKKYDWEILSGYDGETPFLLSGGISPDDAERIKAFSHSKLMGIDVNSGFEISPASKDIALLETFISKIRS